MGLFDKIKEKAKEVANDFKEDYDFAMEQDLFQLCTMMNDLKMLDKKLLGYRSALSQRLECIEDDDQVEALYQHVKKEQSFIKTHPARGPIEDELVRRNMYCRDPENPDGPITRNWSYRKR